MAKSKQLAAWQHGLDSLAVYFEPTGFVTRVLTPDEGVEAPVLLALVPPTEDLPERSFNVSYLPVGDELEYIELLQFFAAVADDIPANRLADVDHYLNVLNATIPLGQVMREEGAVALRHVMVVPKDDLPGAGMVAELIDLFLFIHERAATGLAEIATGAKSGAEAAAALT